MIRYEIWAPASESTPTHRVHVGITWGPRVEVTRAALAAWLLEGYPGCEVVLEG